MGVGGVTVQAENLEEIKVLSYQVSLEIFKTKREKKAYHAYHHIS
jgi:hypothetical protein